MQRTDRLFELIQILRSATQPISAGSIAEQLEVSQRTVYRDIVTLQSMRVPIEGEVGVGYVMLEGYDLPPLNFGHDEIEAIVVGLTRARYGVAFVMDEDAIVDGVCLTSALMVSVVI